MHNCSNNPLATAASPSVTKCISLDTLNMQPSRDVPSACVNDTGIPCNLHATTAYPNKNGFTSGDCNNAASVSVSKNLNSPISQSTHLQYDAHHNENVPDPKAVHPCAKEATTQTTSCAFAPDVLSSCSSSSFLSNSSSDNSPVVNHSETALQTTILPLSGSNSPNLTDENTSIEGLCESQSHIHTGMIHDV